MLLCKNKKLVTMPWLIFALVLRYLWQAEPWGIRPIQRGAVRSTERRARLLKVGQIHMLNLCFCVWLPPCGHFIKAPICGNSTPKIFFYDCSGTILKTRLILSKHYTKFTHLHTQVAEHLISKKKKHSIQKCTIILQNPVLVPYGTHMVQSHSVWTTYTLLWLIINTHNISTFLGLIFH